MNDNKKKNKFDNYSNYRLKKSLWCIFPIKKFTQNTISTL